MYTQILKRYTSEKPEKPKGLPSKTSAGKSMKKKTSPPPVFILPAQKLFYKLYYPMYTK
jgi:hypothetical protein